MAAAKILQELNQKQDAIGWYKKAMQLADLIASDEYALRLYEILLR